MKIVLTTTVLFSNFLLLAYCDNLALLSETLRKFERVSCEEYGLTLSCPQGTSISLVSAKYGSDQRARAGLLCPEINRVEQADETCQLPSSLQYSLLQTAVEGCQKKRNCKLQASPKTFGADPCPGLPKYVTILFKCTPYEFRSKVACENEIVQLKCNPNTRIAIYSASYGRTQYESVQCPQPQGVPEETCLASYATETVVTICHGKRRCTLSVDSNTFGSPCKKESRMYLKVVYTCVPRRVLKPEYEEKAEADEASEAVEDAVDYEEEGMAAPNTSGHHNTSGVMNESVTSHHNRDGVVPTYWPYEEEKSSGKVRRGDDQPRAERSELGGTQLINCTVNIYTEKEKPRVIGFLSQWISVYHFLSNNKERLILYLAVSIGGGLLLLMAVMVARLAWTRRAKPPAPPSSATELPPFTEEMSEAEIDLTIGTPIAVHPEEVVRYGGGTMGESNAPRSLSRSGNSQYYYG